MNNLPVAIFVLNFFVATSRSRNLSVGKACNCDLSTLICVIDDPNGIVDVQDDYCKSRIIAVELDLLRNSHLYASVVPSVRTFRLHITGDYLKEVSENTFVGHEDSLQFLEIKEGVLTEVPISALQHLRRLKFLSLAGNSISSINSSLQVFGLQKLVLMDNRISSIYSDAFPKELSALSLKNNFIDKLNGSLRQHNRLQNLYIARNEITSLEGELEGMSSLSILDASWNRIETIFSYPISLLGLSEMILDHNRIGKLGNSLNGFSNLRTLDLSHNNLKKLYVGAFDNLTELIYLSLSANRIRHLESGVFECQAMLRELLISKNSITTLDGKLDGLFSLKKLDASYNNVKAIGKAFTDLTVLEEIDLSHNSILDLKDGLSKLSKLKKLDLTFNDIKKVDETTFSGAKNLRILNLSFNNIRPLNGGAFASLPKLAKLDLSYNQVQRLQDLVIPGFMGITEKEGVIEETSQINCTCKPRKSLRLEGSIMCMRDLKPVLVVLEENGIDIIGC